MYLCINNKARPINNQYKVTTNVCKGGTGENTPFAEQSRKKERDNGHDRIMNIERLEVSTTVFN